MTIRRMPTAFGPNPSPRQQPGGARPFDSHKSPRRRSVYARFATTAGAIAALVPAHCELRGPPEIAFEYTFLEDIDWLAGRGYNMLSVRVPIRWNGKECIDGWYQPVIWENLTEPILSGREELGWNKIFADLPAAQVDGQSIRVRAEWMGFQFFEMTLDSLSPTPEPPLVGGNLIHHKVIPSTGKWDELEVDYFTLTPAGASKASLLSHATGAASARFIAATWQQMPTQFHITKALAQVPLNGLVLAGVYETIGGKDLSDQRRLELK